MKYIQDRIDFCICRPMLGIPLFFLVMYTVFFLSFYGLGAWLTEYLGTIFFYLTEILRSFLLSIQTNEKIVLFLMGVLSDIASVLSFLPQTAIFFFLIKFLSDSGYMARAVFVADTVLYHFGLSGNALIPLAIGCGCTVPAVVASRELDPNERKILLFSLPFLLCNARFPVLFFLSNTFFPQHKALTAFLFYLLSLFIVFLSCKLSSFRKSAPPLIINLPDYQMPKLYPLLCEAKIKSSEYLNRTATVIFLCSIGFRLSSFLTPQFRFTEIKPQSLLSLLGEHLSFFFAPLGFGKASFSAALFAGFFAKENLLFVLEMLSKREISASLSIPARISFMSFSMLYLPCFSSVVTVFKETNLRKTLFLLFRTFLIAYTVSLILYTISDILVTFVKI